MMVNTPVNPFESPKFRHKRVPRTGGSPPVAVIHSPPRPLTVEDQKDWKVPPCVSDWKNQRRYTIPLAPNPSIQRVRKRLAGIGGGGQIGDDFGTLSEPLYVAEQKAREAVAIRSRVLKEVVVKENERVEKELRALAKKARFERAVVGDAEEGTERRGRRGRTGRGERRLKRRVGERGGGEGERGVRKGEGGNGI